MKIGIPKEVKNNEFRVGATPHAVRAYVELDIKLKYKAMQAPRSGFTMRTTQRLALLLSKRPKRSIEMK